jgi:hypothetical protein
VNGRRLAAAVVGFLAGSAVFAIFAAAGLLLTQRLAGGSGLMLVVILLLFGAAGAYAAWLSGLMAFSALRGGDQGADAEEASERA